MYHFNQSTHQWILHPQSDDIKTSLTDDMYLPKRCQFLTWNILSESIYPDQRYEGIFKTLKSLLPDIICLQEVTKDFLGVLLNEIWLKENNYYIILDSNQNQSYGQLMLMKNVRPRVFSIYPEYIIAQFGLDLNVTIDLVNVHLHKNSVEKRCQSLDDFFRTMKTQNYILIGDFNFGDYDIKEQNLLEKYQYEIHDLWKDIYDLEEVDVQFFLNKKYFKLRFRIQVIHSI
jgi:endonuclease/exonuclease/phosphatase family metal-dependent hydrolase